jgi:hypothetical protein
LLRSGRDDEVWGTNGGNKVLFWEKELSILGKSNEADSDETASLSEEGYRRADCSPPEHIS